MNTSRAVTVTYFLLRIAAALIFMQAGGMKIFRWFGGLPGGATAVPWTQVWWGGVLEVFGGLAIMLGLFTRPVAFLLSGEMAIAYWQFHFPNGSWPVTNNGVSAALYCFVFLFMAAYGGGDWSADAWLARRRRSTEEAEPRARAV